jgi:hypothetical protein
MKSNKLNLPTSENPKINTIMDIIFNKFDSVMISDISGKIKNVFSFLQTQSDTELESILAMLNETKRSISKFKTIGISIKAFIALGVNKETRNKELYPCLLSMESIDDKEFIFDCGTINNGDIKLTQGFLGTITNNIKVDIRRLNISKQNEKAIQYICYYLIRQFGNPYINSLNNTTFQYEHNRHQLIYDNNSINELAESIDINEASNLGQVGYPLLIAKIGLGCTSTLYINDDTFYAMVCISSCSTSCTGDTNIEQQRGKVLYLIKEIIQSKIKEPNTGNNIIYTDNFLKNIHELAVRSEMLIREAGFKWEFDYQYKYESEYSKYQ